ncbi:MAG: hypothetical protein R3C19_06310 [Planctomycetaceae bacterium]
MASRLMLLVFPAIVVLSAGCQDNSRVVAELQSQGASVARNLDDTVKSVRFDGQSPTDADLQKLESFKTLQEVFAVAPDVTDAGLTALNGMEKLHTVSVAGSAVSGDCLATLIKLPALNYLDLSNSSKLQEDKLESLRGNSQIQTLRLTNTNLTDKSIDVIASMTGLKHVRIAGTQVTDEGIAKLATALPGLETLEFGSDQITDSAAMSLAPLTGLQELEILNTQISDEGLGALAGLSKLRILAVHHSPRISDAGIALLGRLPELYSLDVSHSEFTGADFKQAGFVTLTRLFADNTKVTNDNIGSFKGLPELGALKLRGTEVTQEGVSRFFASNDPTAVAVGPMPAE